MISEAGKSNRKSGVALVIVLGLLAVLMITTVAFTTTMRIERSSSANLRHSTQARQVVKGALAYALAELDYALSTTDSMPLWRDDEDPLLPFWTYQREDFNGNTKDYILWKDTLVSLYEDSADANILTADAERYLMPGLAYKGFGRTVSYYDTKEQATVEEDIVQPQWIPVKPDGTNITGRIAYMIFNNSGLLDINCINGADRRLGQYPEEIQVNADIFSSEFRNQAEIDNLFSKRDANGEFTTVAELTAFGGLRSFNPSSNPYALSSFDTFSYQPQTTTDGSSLVDVSGNASSIANNKRKVMEAFYRSGLVLSSGGYDPEPNKPDSEQALWAYLALQDFIDNDSMPAGDNDDEKFCRPVSEKMPLFAGGEALVSIFRTQSVREKVETDPATGKTRTYHEPDPDNCEYELRVMGKVPFVWNYDEQVDSDGNPTFECEAKMAVIADDDGNMPGLFSNLKRVTMRYEYDPSMIPLSPAYADNLYDWVITNKVQVAGPCYNEDNTPIDADWGDLEFSVYFAGATYNMDAPGSGRNKLTRIFPFNYDYYDVDSGDTATIEDRWLKVTLNPKKEGMQLSHHRKRWTGTGKDFNGNPVNESFEIGYSVVHKVIWTEIFDPAFGCLYFKEDGDNTELKANGYYRASVEPEILESNGSIISRNNRRKELRSGAPSQYLKRLNDLFEDFDAANVSNVRISRDFDEDETQRDRDESDLDEFVDGGYFNSSNHGFSPLTDYILANAEILGGDNSRNCYGIYADGIQYNDDVKAADPAFAQRRRYVKNKKLESVGELGYIQVGPYSTIKLYDHIWGDGLGSSPIVERSGDNFAEFSAVPGYGNLSKSDMDGYEFKPSYAKSSADKVSPDAMGYHTVLDYFTVSPDVTRGKININSSSLPVLASAYYDMPLNNDVYDLGNESDADNSRRLDFERSFDMAYLMLGVDEGFTRLSDFGRIYSVKGVGNEKNEIVITEDTSLEDLAKGAQILYAAIAQRDGDLDSAVSGKTGYGAAFNYNLMANRANRAKRYGEFERESLIRNACGLFTDRGQTFTILLRAEAFSSYYGAINVREGTVNAVKTAVAQVWRDNVPRKGPNGKVINPFVIKYFKILDE